MNYFLYFDPGLGAMVAQAAIAALAGFVLFYKTVVATVKGWIGLRNQKKDSSFDNNYDADSETN